MQLIENCQDADLYYCECCGQFYDRQTHFTVNVPLSSLSAEFAIEVMAARGQSSKSRQKTRTAANTTKGFGK
jgi:hypothetical protein